MSSYSIWSKVSTWIAMGFGLLTISSTLNGKFEWAAVCLWISAIFTVCSLIRWTEGGRSLFPQRQVYRDSRAPIPPIPSMYWSQRVMQPAPHVAVENAQAQSVEQSANQAVQVPASASLASKALGFLKGNLYWFVFGFVSVLAVICAAFGQFWLAFSMALMAIGMEINRNNKGGAIMHWIKTIFVPFLWKHWNGVWLGLSLAGLSLWFCQIFLGGAYASTGKWLLASSLLAAFTMRGGWGKSTKKLSEVLAGKYGLWAPFALIAVCTGSYWPLVQRYRLDSMAEIAQYALAVAMVAAVLAMVFAVSRTADKKKK